MVGFKTIFLILSMLVLVACVPSTKKTSCGADEAFNASLRTCVPVVPGPTSFINISSFIPTAALTAYKNDVLFRDFSVYINNPYALTYTTTWSRVYQGITYPVTPTTATSWRVRPVDLNTQLGLHLITVNVKDQNNNITDSHVFQITVTNTPTPSIKDATVSPTSYYNQYTPLDTVKVFSFSAPNNGAVYSPGEFFASWKLEKDGAHLSAYDEDDAFTSGSADNIAQFSFSPSVLGVGNYYLRSRISDSNGNISDEQVWSISVKHPDLILVDALDVIQGTPTANSQPIIAYDGIAYSQHTQYSFVPKTFVPQANFCVKVLNGDGIYPSPSVDTKFIEVKFYLDSQGSPIFTKKTTASTREVCLSEIPTPANILFANVSSSVEQTHYITARIFDEASNKEYADAQMNGNGTYPVKWAVKVQPKNAAPAVSFYSPTGSTASCTASSIAYTRDCNVTQGTAFTIGLTMADDFYNTFPADDNKFAANFQLRMDGVVLPGATSSCTKTTANISSNNDVTGVNDYTGPNFVCSITVPHYHPTTKLAIDPSAYVFDIIATISDVGSPITGSLPAVSNSMTWKLANITETTTTPALGALNKANGYASVTPSTTIYLDGTNTNPVGLNMEFPESSPVRFRVDVTDPEGDNFFLEVSRYDCVESTVAVTPSCSTLIPIYSQSITNNAGNAAKRVEFVMSGDQFRIKDPASCGTVGAPATCIQKIFFKVEVTEQPSTITALPAVNLLADQNYSNVNPVPTLSGTPLPNPAVTQYALSGLPITFFAGTLGDTSTATAEAQLSSGWYIKKAATGTFTAIPGASASLLVWTPNSDVVAATENIEIRYCFSDGTNVYPIDPTSTRCGASWTIKPWSNIIAPTTPVPPFTSTGSTRVAVARDSFDAFTYFNAHIDSSGDYINLNKTSLDRASTTLDPYNKNFLDFLLPVAPAAAPVANVNELSLTSTDGSLLVAYRMDLDALPGTQYIAIRNIDKNISGSQAKTSTNFINNGAFGFRYEGITLDATSGVTVPPTTNCDQTTYACNSSAPVTPLPRGTAPRFDLSAATINNFDSIEINGEPITFINTVNSVNPDLTLNAVCWPCTTIRQAEQIARVINESSEPAWQGLTAVWGGAGSTAVTIYGSMASDFIDYSTNQALSIGKIAIDNDQSDWFLPYVNLSQANRISVLAGTVPAAHTVISRTVTNTNTPSTLASIKIASAHFNEVMYVASINQLGSTGQLYRYTISAGVPVLTNNQVIFRNVNATGLTKIRISPPTAANPYVYVIAQDSSDKWYFGRYNATSISPINQFYLSSKATTVTQTMINDANPCAGTCNVRDMQISTFNADSEARIVVASDTLSTAVFKPYLLRAKFDTGTNDYDIFCDHASSASCEPVANFGILPNAPMALSSEAVSSGIVGSAGNVPGENNKPIVFGAFPRDAASDDVVTILMNAKNENISATSADFTNFLYRPAIIAD